MDLIYYFWLSTINGLNSKKISRIIEYFGELKDAWQGTYEDFLSIKGITPSLAESIIARRNGDKLLKEISDIESKGINIITIDNKEYPEKLKDIYDPPFILYIKGELSRCSRYIAVVGSRKCTAYGRMVAKNISKLLSDYGIGIVSGMARGIDTEAHLGALDANGITWAVLGCGCDVVYPPENKNMMEEIEKKGAIISEYIPGTKPYPSNFPARNRIISGLSDGVLVVEAGEKSGALITVEFALEQGRDVFAIPGSILSKPSMGTNKLIKDGARMVTDVTDILEEICIEYNVLGRANSDIMLTTGEKILLDIISNSPIYIDDLVQNVALRVGEVNSIITSLELKGMIKILPGKYAVRTF